MVIPHFLFTNYSLNLNKQFKIVLFCLICFLPQLIINTLSLFFIYYFKESMTNIDEKLFLIISTGTNTILNILCSIFSIIKVIFKF